MYMYLIILVNIYAVDGLASQCADLSFGCRQVEQVMCDQPDMAETISDNPSLRQMLICHFAGAFGEGRVYWDCREPDSGRPAEHLLIFSGYPAMVRVSKQCGTSSIDKCFMLVFELLNLELDKEIQPLATAEVQKRKSRDEFAIQCVRLEYEALKRTHAYFREHPLASANVDRDPHYFADLADDFPDYLQFLDENKEDYDPRQYFRGLYDELVPSARSNRRQ